jgi:hypothetical protein
LSPKFKGFLLARLNSNKTSFHLLYIYLYACDDGFLVIVWIVSVFRCLVRIRYFHAKFHLGLHTAPDLWTHKRKSLIVNHNGTNHWP